MEQVLDPVAAILLIYITLNILITVKVSMIYEEGLTTLILLMMVVGAVEVVRVVVWWMGRSAWLGFEG